MLSINATAAIWLIVIEESEGNILKIAILSCFLALSLLALACSGGRGDPLAPGGGASLSPGAGRANLAVDESNSYEACQVFFENIHGHYNKALGGNSSATGTSEMLRIIGNHNGYGLVTMIDPDTTQLDTTDIPAVMLEYVNFYSETGMLFYDGKLELQGEWRRTDGAKRLYKFSLNGTVNVSGDYSCQLKFESFWVALNPDGSVLDMLEAMQKPMTHLIPVNGTLKIISGSRTIRFSPYVFDHGPGSPF